jgi:tetratricopeptide (TPR) repeat protein
MSIENLRTEARHESAVGGGYEKITEKNFKLIVESADKRSGLFSAVDPKFETTASKEDHMPEAWIRDTSWNLISLIETAKSMGEAGSNAETIPEMREFVQEDLKKLLALLNQDRWLDRFWQHIIDNGTCTYLSGEPPEVHMKIDGAECHWDQNQPESWGALLIAIGTAKDAGIVKEYSAGEIRVIRGIMEYLTKIKPWKFAGAGMWEGVPAHSPSSRSNALAIAKGLDATLSLFADHPDFQKWVNDVIDQTMRFVKEDINTDYTVPEEHRDGADLAMLVSMVLPETERTALPFITYIEENGAKLGIDGSLPGAIRFIGDSYKKGELGEARWFMANPILAIGYLREAEKEFGRGNLEQARDYQQKAHSFLEQALEISRYYGHDPELFPELFIQRDPENVKDEDKAKILEMHDGKRTVALQPLERSLVWNSALVMAAGALADRVAQLNNNVSESVSVDMS